MFQLSKVYSYNDIQVAYVGEQAGLYVFTTLDNQQTFSFVPEDATVVKEVPNAKPALLPASKPTRP